MNVTWIVIFHDCDWQTCLFDIVISAPLSEQIDESKWHSFLTNPSKCPYDTSVWDGLPRGSGTDSPGPSQTPPPVGRYLWSDSRSSILWSAPVPSCRACPVDWGDYRPADGSPAIARHIAPCWRRFRARPAGADRYCALMSRGGTVSGWRQTRTGLAPGTRGAAAQQRPSRA